MRVILLNDSRQALGGSWSFLRNLSKGLKALSHRIVDTIPEAQIALVSGVTMVNRDTIQAVKSQGVKLVVRVDNVPRASRNRGSGTSRLKDFCEWADEVVYQCLWARDYLGDFIGRKGVIIYNGVDTDVFNEDNATRDKDRPVYLYSRFSKDPTKNWWEAWYKYQFVHRDNPKSRLWIVGRLPQEMRETAEYNWDFYNGENVEYFGIITDVMRMAEIYKASSYLMASYYIDCYSQTYLEAATCGCELHSPNMSGGTPELLENLEKGKEFNSLERMTKDYVRLFEKLLS